jgi:hypothetical protein
MIKKAACLILLALGYLNVFSQQVYDSLLNRLNEQYPQEKLYMQFDKGYYSPGETLWFKAYILAGAVPSPISKTLYTELVNAKGTVLQRKTMPFLQAGAASFFELPDSTKKSELFIRAYTAWMLNFDSSLLYVKAVNMIHAGADAAKANTVSTFSLSVFPEGGDLVENIESRIAFKTNDQDGKPFAVKGSLTDSKGKTLGIFTSTHNGMGTFNLLPAPGEKYKLLWKDPKGMPHETLLPLAKSIGTGLKTEAESSNLSYSITRQPDAPEDFKEYIVLAQMHQQTVYAAKINLRNKTSATAPIVTDSLGDGILQITVFNKAQVPVAERIVFINHATYSFATDLHIIEKNMKPRGRNVLQVDVGGRFKTNLSVAVTDAELDVKEGPQQNIFSELLLTGDLKADVYNPAYYFSSDEDSVAQQLDLVMMTNGWRRYNWQKLLAGEWPIIKYMPDDYLTIQGNIFGLSSSQLTGKSLTGILRASEKSSPSFITIPVNKDGSFKLSGIYFFDTIKIYYQLDNDKNKTLTSSASFSFNTGLAKSPALSPQFLAAIKLATKPPQNVLLKSIRQNELYLSQQKLQKVKVLETVTVTAQTKSVEEKVDKQYASGLFSGGNSRVFATEDDPFAKSAVSILDYLRGKVAGLQITTNGPTGGSITRRGSNTDVFLNEMNADISTLQSTPMSDVAMIKVFDPPFFGATGGGAGGAVAVYTKKGQSSNSSFKGLDSYMLHGYSSIKEFYVPNYETNPSAEIPDYRSTLYWNPFLLMDAKTRRISIPFFNNDGGKKIRVIIEGLNEAGELTREEKVFE